MRKIDLHNLNLTSDEEFLLRLFGDVLDGEIEEEADETCANVTDTAKQIATILTDIIIRNIRAEIKDRAKGRSQKSLLQASTSAVARPQQMNQ